MNQYELAEWFRERRNKGNHSFLSLSEINYELLGMQAGETQRVAMSRKIRKLCEDGILETSSIFGWPSRVRWKKKNFN